MSEKSSIESRGGFGRRAAAATFSSMPPRLFRFLRLLPGVGDTMLSAIDATFEPQTLLLKRIRSGPLAGMALEVDPRALDMVIGRYEPAIQEVIATSLHRDDVAFDIGANLGYFTLVMANQVTPGGRVVSFEPDPHMLSALERNVTRNISDSRTVAVVGAAAGAKTGTAGFATGWRATRGKVVPHGGDLQVEATRVDDEAERFGAPRLLKIDVEGAEFDVLQGATDVLKSERPVVLVEVHSDELERRCADLLETFGYVCSRRVDRGKREPYLVAT